MTSINKWAPQSATQPSYLLAHGIKEAHNALAGKTLAQVGAEQGLNNDDVDITPVKGRGDEYYDTLRITIGKTNYLVPLSRSFPKENIDNPEFMLNCMFRESFVTLKKDGAVVQDENGKDILDESKPYLTFGKPNGITIGEGRVLFDEASMPEEEKALVAAGGKTTANKATARR